MKNILNIFSVFLVFITLNGSFAEEITRPAGKIKNTGSKLRTIEWKEISSENGIIVYSPKSYTHDSGLVPIRFKATLDHNISRVLSVLADEKRKLEWMPRAVKIQELERKSVNVFTIYYRYSAPWPFNDRDFIIQNNGNYSPEKLQISVDVKSVKHKKDPAPSDTVRGWTYDGYVIIKPSKDLKQTSVEMALLTEFGGMIPTFIINIIQRQWPYDMMKNLRTQLDKNDIIINPEFLPKKHKKKLLKFKKTAAQ